MSPEYAMNGVFSFKSDVYSFGVLVLEIVSGQKSMSPRSSEHPNLISYVSELLISSNLLGIGSCENNA